MGLYLQKMITKACEVCRAINVYRKCGFSSIDIELICSFREDISLC